MKALAKAGLGFSGIAMATILVHYTPLGVSVLFMTLMTLWSVCAFYLLMAPSGRTRPRPADPLSGRVPGMVDESN